MIDVVIDVVLLLAVLVGPLVLVLLVPVPHLLAAAKSAGRGKSS